MTTPKQRMLNAYRGIPNDRPPVAPEFWYYYPAKLMGLDMLEFHKVPFHLALKRAFEHFGCEGWGIAGVDVPRPELAWQHEETWDGPDTLLRCSQVKFPDGAVLTTRSRADRHEPGWVTERLIKDLDRDLPAWEFLALGGDVAQAQTARLDRAREEVGESYLLECVLGVPFFDFYAESRQGGLEQAIFDLLDRPAYFTSLQRRYQHRLVAMVDAVCARSTVESFFIGCSWSCVSCLGPQMWRQYDAPVIRAVADAVHRHGRLLHLHFHGKTRAVLDDLGALGCDCICPFERGPGGDIDGVSGLWDVRRALGDRVTMNGNVHTVQTLIRGTPADVRREVDEIRQAFAGTSRVIIGTGDQVGRETPEENVWAMIDAAR